MPKTRFLPAIAAVLVLLAAARSVLAVPGAEEPFRPRTKVSLSGSTWRLDGKPTYAGSRAEGLLLNASMLNACFEDRNPATRPAGFDAEKNVEAFAAAVPGYVAHGVRAFTIGLQGADPGYAGALCSAFEPDGAPREDYLSRAARAIEACDRAGAAVILSCFSAEQDQVLKDEAAVKKALLGAVAWIARRGYTNVILEVAHGYPQKGFDHEAIRDEAGVRQLIRAAKAALPGLLVSASGGPGGRADHPVSIESDFILLHFHNVLPDEVLERVASADKVSKAIVCNADRKTGAAGARSLESAVDAMASWGFQCPANQKHPFRYGGAADDPVVYGKLQELTSPGK